MSAEATAVSTSLAAMRGATAPVNAPAIRMGFDTHAGFELLQRAAKMFAASSIVPAAYQGNLANCAVAVNMANRLGADALMVMQNLYIVHGNPGWSSKFLIASVNTCGRFSSMRYEWKGKEGADDYGCRAWAIEKETGERLNGTWIDWKMVKAEGWHNKNGSKWKTMPDQMFVYRAAAFWQRAYAPEISMGLSTVEDLEDALEAKRGADGSFAVDMDALRDAQASARREPITVEAGQPPTREALAVEDLKALMRAAGSLESLETLWTQHKGNYSDDALLDLEAFRNIRKEQLQEAAKGGGK